MASASPLLNILVKSIRNIRKFILRDFYEIEKLQSSIRTNETFINNSVTRLENEISTILEKIKPDSNLKIDNNQLEDESWIIDFNDFNFNFSRANDNLGIGIGFLTNNLIKSYLFYNPVKDDFFCFEKGSGAFKNDFRIRVSNKLNKEEIIVSIFQNYDETKNKESIKLIKNLLSNNSIIQRESGSLNFDLCNLACGKIDCSIFINPSKKTEIIAKLILAECGGKINILDFKDSRIFICTNKFIEKTVKQMIENNIIKS